MKFAVIYAAAVCLTPAMLIAQVPLPEPPVSVVVSTAALLIAFVAWKRRKAT